MTPIETSPGLVVNIATPDLKLCDFRLIAFDMDSTLINIECVDEIADAAGRKAVQRRKRVGGHRGDAVRGHEHAGAARR